MYHGRHIGCDGRDCVAGGDVKKINNAGDQKKKECVALQLLLLLYLPDGIRVCTINRTHTCSIIIQTRALHEYSSVNYYDATGTTLRASLRESEIENLLSLLFYHT